MSGAEPDDGPEPSAANGDRDSADITAILEDTDLSDTILNIRTARKVPPENPARALRLLDLIGTHRPVEGLIDDAARFSRRRGGDRDAAHILGVAALHRSVADTARILLAKWPSDLAKDVARTFARQRPTLDVPSLIRFLKSQPDVDQASAVDVVGTILDEFAWGDVRPNVSGRPIRDISLVHVRLTAERCHDEAYALLSRVFEVDRPPRFAYDLACDLLHDTPRTDVLGEWARTAVEDRSTRGAALHVIRELIHYSGPGASGRARRLTHKIGTLWSADWLATLCVTLDDCTDRVEDGLVHDCADKAAAIRRLAASRDDLDFVTALITAWWADDRLSGTWETVLDEAVSRPVPTPAPLAVRKVNLLAKWVAEDAVPEAADLIRAKVHLAGSDGTDAAELIGAMQPRARRREAFRMGHRMAAAAKDRSVTPEAVAEYIRSLRAADWPGSRQAADDARHALTPGTGGDPSVVARAAVALADRKPPAKGGDADALLTRYLTNHSGLVPEDVVAVFEHLEPTPEMTEEYLKDLTRRTLARWPPVPRKEVAGAFRNAGMTDRADQISRR